MDKYLHIDDDLLVKFLLGEATVSERLQVEQWIEESADNKKKYEQLATIWEKSKQLTANSVEVDETEAWQAFQKRIAETPYKNLRRKKSVFSLSFTTVMTAAAVIILLIGGWLFYQSDKETYSVATVVKTSGDSVLHDTLPDRSIITLNKHSSLLYPALFKNNKREVSLTGEAFFNVSPDKIKPFVIQANGVTITVVGTSFNVKSSKETTQIIVESGVVKVSSRQHVIELHKGEQTTVTTDSSLVKTKTEDSLYRYYRTRVFDCESTPLSSVLSTLNEVYSAHLVAGSEEVNHLRLTATFKEEESLETIVGVIEQTFNLKATQQESNTVLSLDDTPTEKKKTGK